MRLQNDAEAVRDPQILDDLAEAYGAKVSLTLLAHWGLDEELQEVARSGRDWFRDHGNKPDLADVILLVNLHVLTLAGEAHLGLPAIDTVPACRKFKAGPISPRGTLQVLDEVTDVEEMDASITA